MSDSIDIINTGIAALTNGEMEFNERYCRCDPAVGMAPCEYCAILQALMIGRKSIEQQQPDPLTRSARGLPGVDDE